MHFSVMYGIIVNRHVHALPAAQRVQMCAQKVGFKRVGVIVIEGGALVVGHIGMSFIIVIVMDNGMVVDVGNHESLLKTSAIYQEVYESQKKGGAEHE